MRLADEIFSRLSLRKLLTVPYVLLILTLALTMGTLSYRAGQHAIDDLSGQLLAEMVNRIGQAVDRHVAGSSAVLESAFPDGVSAPEIISGADPDLRTRFWLATSVHRDPNNYAYYGDQQGRFFGLWRHTASQAELRLRPDGQGPRTTYGFSGINGALQSPVVEQRIFDPRERPWYKAAQSGAAPTWTSIYIDFKTSELIATRARRVNNKAGEFQGVVATDLSLQKVNSFLKGLALSANSLAMVVEADGNIIGLSRGAHLTTNSSGQNVRLNAANSKDPLVAETYVAVHSLLSESAETRPRAGVFKAADGQLVQVSYARMRDDTGLDWVIMVAVPRHDFLASVERNFAYTVLLTVVAVVVAVLLGLSVLSTVTRELQNLAFAAKRFGEGRQDKPLQTDRSDELGDLARSFTEMQSRLMTDHLTGLSNRAAVLRRIESNISERRQRNQSRPFAVVFTDVNRFKQINDRYGHDVGDEVLRELGHRLRSHVRSEDMVARYAGDEFVIVVDSVQQQRDAEALREHLENALREPLSALAPFAPDDIPAGASFGIAMYPFDGQDADALIKCADKNMYSRKSALSVDR